MPGELPGERTSPAATVTAVAIVPVPEIVPAVNVIGFVREVAELYLNSPPWITTPVVVLMLPVGPIRSVPALTLVVPL